MKHKSHELKHHHIIPTSRGGGSLENNIAFVPQIEHEKYHTLFINRTPVEIIDYLVRTFWNGRQDFVEEYLEGYKRRI